MSNEELKKQQADVEEAEAETDKAAETCRG